MFLFNRHFLVHCLLGFLALGISQAHAYSYSDAKQRLLLHSPTLLFAKSLQEAATADALAIEYAEQPTISLNGYGLMGEQSTALSLDKFNATFDQRLTHLNQNTLNLPPLQPPSVGVQGTLVGANLSAVAPLYTGGFIGGVKDVARLNADIQTLNTNDAYNRAQLELIRHYFDVQLKKALLDTEKKWFNAIEHHTQNAQKLEKQGFISKGQRLQFQVAQNQALRAYQLAHDNHKSSLFALQTLLEYPSINALSTPLFINLDQSLSWQELLEQHENTAFMQKLHKGTEIAEQKITIAKSATKPKVFAVGQYAPLDNDWFLGVAARYELWSGIDHTQAIYASEQQKNATVFATQKAKSESHTLMHRAFLDFNGSKASHRLLNQNLTLAKENLRLQTLAFKEGVGTVSGVVDAEAAIAQIQSERAINAYRYIMALATLLHSVDRLDNFAQYASLFDTITIDL